MTDEKVPVDKPFVISFGFVFGWLAGIYFIAIGLHHLYLQEIKLGIFSIFIGLICTPYSTDLIVKYLNFKINTGSKVVFVIFMIIVYAIITTKPSSSSKRITSGSNTTTPVSNMPAPRSAPTSDTTPTAPKTNSTMTDYQPTSIPTGPQER